jgi:ABC-type uncharacterized transport system substrate-binding protein
MRFVSVARFRQFIFWLLATIVLTHSPTSHAQPLAKRVPRLGVLLPGVPATYSPRTAALQQALRELGYVEGKTLTIEWRWAEDRVERLPELAVGLVKSEVDVIVTQGTPASKALKDATKSIPVVMAMVGDPVATGLVASLAHPGGNLTGLTNIAPELSGKRLELLQQAVPKANRIAVLTNPTSSVTPIELKETQLAAQTLGLQIEPFEAREPNAITKVFGAIAQRRFSALLVLTDAIFYSRRRPIINAATKSRLPAMYFNPEFAEDGGLMFYGPSSTDFYRRAAVYVDKILKGTKPADLPVERPIKFDFIINLKAAKQIGLTIPQSLLYRADKVIK